MGRATKHHRNICILFIYVWSVDAAPFTNVLLRKWHFPKIVGNILQCFCGLVGFALLSISGMFHILVAFRIEAGKRAPIAGWSNHNHQSVAKCFSLCVCRAAGKMLTIFSRNVKSISTPGWTLVLVLERQRRLPLSIATYAPLISKFRCRVR